ncbi:unnamed protein product [Arabidopsis halleri]
MAGATTRVFWDVDDFPVPPGKPLDSFPKNIKDALEIEGYISDVSFFGYDAGKLSYKAMCHYRKAQVLFVHQSEKKCTRLNSMLLDMIDWAYQNPPTRSSQKVNLLVIAKDIPDGDTEFVSVCERLQQRNYNVFVVVPDDCPEEELPLPSTASLVWRWTNLFDGGIPIEPDSDEDEVCETVTTDNASLV